MLVRYEVRTLINHSPFANIAIFALNIISFVLLVAGVFSAEWLDRLVLHDWNLTGFLGYQFLHGGILHLGFNLIYLWVFGNALCGVINNFLYAGIYLLLGALAGVVHLLLDGSLVIGA